MKNAAKKEKKKITTDADHTPVYQTSPEMMPAGDTSLLPIDPETKRPLAPMAQPGYYPGYSTLGQQEFWDEATRKVVLDRVHNVPPIRFFTPEQATLMKAVCDRLLPQDDRDEQHKIPIVNAIDKRLYENVSIGYQYEDMPPDSEAMTLGLQAIDEIAQHIYTMPFTQLGPREQDEALTTIRHGNPPAAHDIWKKMAVHHFWMLIMQDVVQAYYAHPYAWDEIGFGGPAYPRGYMRLDNGKPEPWEVDEVRYDWKAPITSLSGQYEPVGGPDSPPLGQGGTH